MALSFVGSGSDAGTAGNNPSMTLPVGIAENDVNYVAVMGADTADRDMAMSTSGYTELVEDYRNDNSDTNFAVYRKVMGVTPDSTAVYDAITHLSGQAVVAAFHCWRGCDTSAPEDATTTTTGATNGGTPDPPSITTVTNGAVVLAIGGSSEGDAVSNAPTNYENLIDLQASQANIMIASRAIATADAEDPGTFADVAGTGADSWAAATVAIRPAADAGGGGFRSRIAGGFVRV